MTSRSVRAGWRHWATRPVGPVHWDRILHLAGLIGLVSIGLSAFVPKAADLTAFFSLTLLINGPYSPLLPVGYEPVLMTYGQLYSPLLIAAVGVTGQVLVESVNYRLYGSALQSALLSRMRCSRLVSWLVSWFNASPFLAVVVAALTPLPFWAVRIAAPLARYPMRRYLTATALGRFPRLWFYAALGSLIPLNGALIFTGGMAVSAVVAGVLLHRHRRPAATTVPDHERSEMIRRCPGCQRALDAMAIRCACGHVLPEAQNARTDPEHPACEVCGAGIALMDERCAACGAEGYPALRPRRSRKWQGSPTHRPFVPCPQPLPSR